MIAVLGILVFVAGCGGQLETEPTPPTEKPKVHQAELAMLREIHYPNGEATGNVNVITMKAELAEQVGSIEPTEISLDDFLSAGPPRKITLPWSVVLQSNLQAKGAITDIHHIQHAVCSDVLLNLRDPKLTPDLRPRMRAADLKYRALSAPVPVQIAGKSGQGNILHHPKHPTRGAVVVEKLSCLILPSRPLAAGGQHSVILQGNGTVLAFGSGASGQLGRGPVLRLFSDGRPMPVVEIQDAASIAAGTAGAHTVVVRRNGAVSSFGFNSSGQLGDGSRQDSGVPVQARGIHDAIAAAAGHHHTVVLRRNGTPLAFGSNADGQLGNESNQSSLIPGPVAKIHDAVEVAAGESHTVVLRRDGTVFTFGRNDYGGPLGNGSSENRPLPGPVAGIEDAISVAAGWRHTLVLRRNGTVMAFGANQRGQLGNNSVQDSAVPVPVEGVHDAIAVAAGLSSSLILNRNGTVMTFGIVDMPRGDGDNSDQESHVPVAVPGVHDAIAVAAGSWHALIQTRIGSVLSFGNNVAQQLGGGSELHRLVPMPVQF